MKKLLKALMFLLAISMIAAASFFLLINSNSHAKGWWASLNTTKATVKGDSIVVGCAQEPLILNPFLSDGTLAPTKIVMSNVLWGLLTVTPDFKYAPRIAKKVPTLENGLVTEDPFTVTFKIKKDAVWSDGEPITAEDVGFTWRVIMNPRYPIADRSGYDIIDRIDTPNERTVRIVFKKPYAAYKNLFSTTHPILPKHVLERYDVSEVINNIMPFASGPYKFKEWKRGSHLTIVKNEHFWEQKPHIEKVTFKFIPNISDLLSRFVRGKVNVIYFSSSEQFPFIDNALDYLKPHKGNKVEVTEGAIWEHIAFNLSRPPLNDINVRKAIVHAINRERIAARITGSNKVLQSILQPSQKSLYVPAWDKYDFDVKKAGAYLEKAGYHLGKRGYFEKDGEPLIVEISTTAGNLARENIEVLIKNDLERLGIQTKIVNTAKKDFLGSRITNGDFDLAIWAWLANPEPRLDQLFAANGMPPVGQNYYGYRNNHVSQMLKESTMETKQVKRERIFHKVQEMVSNDIVVIPLFQRPEVLAYDKQVSGVKNNISFGEPFWNLAEWHILP